MVTSLAAPVLAPFAAPTFLVVRGSARGRQSPECLPAAAHPIFQASSSAEVPHAEYTNSFIRCTGIAALCAVGVLTHRKKVNRWTSAAVPTRGASPVPFAGASVTLGPQPLFGGVGRAKAVVREAGLEDGDVELIQATWDKAKTKAGLEGVGVLLFKNIFDTAPEALQLFPFKGKNWEEKPAFKKHATDVAGTVDTAVSLLLQMDTLAPVLDDLGKRHAGYGVLAGHYPVVGGALIGTLKTALVEEFTEPVEASWGRLWAIITETMLRGAEKAELPEK